MGKPTVLCVDADLSNLVRHEALLKSNGYNVLISTSGRQGCKLLVALPIDAVVLSLQLPGMSRGVLASRMKQLKPQVPILLTCPSAAFAENQPEGVDACLSQGDSADKFLTVVNDLVSTRASFFDEWFWDWKRRLIA